MSAAETAKANKSNKLFAIGIVVVFILVMIWGFTGGFDAFYRWNNS